MFIGLVFYQINQYSDIDQLWWSIHVNSIFENSQIYGHKMNIDESMVVLQKHRIGLVGFCVDFGITGS